MLLKRLELSGFKSFGRQSALDFTAPVTAIVGPNGSGKSNIVESVRFVLGEQSIKSLRGKRGEDLIFNGTHTMPRQSKASVTIVFDNTKRIFNVDYDEVAIRRVVYRDSGSEYSVNGSIVRLKDIIEMLSSVHIGVSNHHIISQGEADHILSASIKERRNMVEDALGLKIYQYKKLESVRKLDKTKENLDQVKALQKEIEPHLRFLEKQVAKIKQGETLRDELKHLYTTYFSIEEAHIKSQKTKLEDEKKVPQHELTEIDKHIAQLQKKLNQSEAGQSKNEEVQGIERELDALRQKKETLSRTLGRIEGAIEYEERKIKEEEERGASRKDVIIPLQPLNDLRDTLTLYNTKAHQEHDGKNLLQTVKDMFTVVEVFFAMHVLRNTVDSPINILKESLVQKQKERTNLNNELSSLRLKETTLQEHFLSIKKSVDENSATLRKDERELFTLQNKKTELLSKIELLTIREEQYELLHTEMQNMLKEAHTFVGTLSLHETAHEEDRSKQEERKRSIERIKIKLEEIGTGGGDIMKEHKEVLERDEFLKNQIIDLEKSAESLLTLIKELEEKIDEEFKDGVQKINVRFQELFTIMFGGGNASLKVLRPLRKKTKKDLEDDLLSVEDIENDVEEELEEGIDIDISLPKKKIRGLHMLSGGERSLVSIALIFAITQVNPPPFLILDETDAALDEVNSQKYGEMLKNLAKETQLILITHNRETMAHAKVLYGVTAVEGASRLLSVKFDEAVLATQVK